MTLPAGLLDDNIEFFNHYPNGSAEEVSVLMSGCRYAYQEFPEIAINLIDKDMIMHPDKVAALMDIGIDDIDAQRRKYISCNFGAFDGEPDIAEGKLLETEYWPCPARGTCPVEGRLCNALKTPTGEHLTKRETEVLKLVVRGLLNKEIADLLNMSELTVKTHNTRIQAKLGPNSRKADMVRFACEHKLI